MTNVLPAADPDDWLGYSAYADALWSRIQTALIKSEGTNAKLGDDPLVIGVFGEWGAGKSKLLSLMQDRSRSWANERIGWRKRDGGNFGLTVPVYFQPWKYEHEEHLHVPILLHILAALKEELEAAQTWGEWAGQVVPSWVTEHMGKVVAAFGMAANSAAWALDTTVPLASRAGLGIAGALAKWLPKSKKANEEKFADPAATLKFEDSGRYFYEIHEILKAITRPRQHGKYLQGVNLSADLPINFVIFIDDLDRCLPEKAVQTLELIKTIFNAESFAFVLALDDEVIERGIGHRYKEYQLVGKKPEMPITGFEYLEKIVHVPFRLPALTRAQASEFVRQYERDIEPDAALRWFEPVTFQPDALLADAPPAGAGAKGATGGGAATRGMQKPDLLELALSGFDAFMPRKLIRMVELMHQVAKIAAIRNTPLQVGGGGVDVRVVLALLLIQLFQPELHRILRRRDESFPVLLAAFANKDDGTKDSTRELNDARVSDIDLWQWAVNSAHAGQRDAWDPPDFDKTYGYAVQQIGLTHKDDSFERVNAQIVRLPLVAQIITHRAVNRHVFDVLKLVTALAASMGAAARALTISPYFSLLSQQTGLPKASIELAMHSQSNSTATLTLAEKESDTETRPRFDLRSVEDLADVLLSADEAVQANLASRIDLRGGEFLSASSAAELINSLKASFAKLETLDDGSLAKGKLNLLSGLRYLAPYLASVDAKSLWQFVNDSLDFTKPIEPQTRALWGDVRSLLGCDDRFDPQRPYLFKSRFSGHEPADEPICGFVRIPNGPFQMGNKDDEDNPPRKVTVDQPYYISRTLVTVQQYARFIKAGGYADVKDWWDKQGVDWRYGKFDSKIKDEDYKKWLAQRSVDLRQQPMSWAEQEKLESRPVWGVTWFEARAYARWLDAELRNEITAAKLGGNYQIMLPTEIQWERAARANSKTTADSRRWPWGDDENQADQQANLNQKVGSVSAVGLYPPNSIGLYDMAGNAWEWMDNLYSAKTDKMARVVKDVELMSNESLGKSDLPTLRGGSWFDHPGDARCSCRGWVHADGWINIIGFRVVLSLAN